MKFKTHPLVSALKVNEDGSSIFYNGQALDIKNYRNSRRNYDQLIVNFNSQTHTVVKLVCETWNGMRDDMDLVIKRRDLNPNNNHYTNLYWGQRGGYRTKKTKRPKSSKVTEKEVEEIIERLKKGDSLSAIAKDYNTSDMSIYRIKNRFIKSKKMLLKERIMNAKDNYDKRFAYARFFGYESIGKAISVLGRNEFIAKCQNVVL